MEPDRQIAAGGNEGKAAEISLEGCLLAVNEIIFRAIDFHPQRQLIGPFHPVGGQLLWIDVNLSVTAWSRRAP